MEVLRLQQVWALFAWHSIAVATDFNLHALILQS